MAREDISKHEKVCAERWGLLIKVMLLLLAAWLTCSGWLIVQLYASSQAQIAAIQQLRGEK
jgi:hypothetical protein